MAIEYGVITGIILIMAIVFFRKKRKQWGFATLPLMLVPFSVFCLSFVLVHLINMQISMYVGIIILISAVAASCAWIGFASNGLKNKSTRVTYIIIANLFNVLLAAILIYNILRDAGSIIPTVDTLKM